MLIERHFPEFDESLLTAVELTDRTTELGPYTREMLAQTCRRAAEPMISLSFWKAMQDGTTRSPSSPSTTARPSWTAATQLFTVPRSIPRMIPLMFGLSAMTARSCRVIGGQVLPGYRRA